MDKTKFKTSFLHLLEQEVNGLTSEKKIKYMKKWIRDYEQNAPEPSENIEDPVKIGLLVRETLSRIIKLHLLSDEKVKLLQDERYCKYTFDINYPFFKKVVWNLPITEQRKIKGYDRYWSNEVTVNNEEFLICNDWYVRNNPKFIKWVKELEK